jgi:hypothetical protein
MSKKKVLILSYTHLDSDPRIRRQIEALSVVYDVYTSGLSAVSDKSVPFEKIYWVPQFSLMRKIKRAAQYYFRSYDGFYWDAVRLELRSKLNDLQPDVIIANDIHTLPLALSLKSTYGVLFDAHEFHPEEFTDQLKWKLFDKPYLSYLCRKYIPQAKEFTTVSNGIAERYHSFCGRKPSIVTNASKYQDLQPSELQKGVIRIIHHGAALRSRNLEEMIDTARILGEGYTLDMMLTKADADYYKEINAKAKHISNVRFIDAVPFDNICSVLNKYDIGLFLLPPSNVNYLHALPNKIFEFVQARLCIAVSPSPEMSQVVKEYDLGIISADFTSGSMATAIKKLSPEKVRHYKEQAHIHAKELSAERNFEKIRSLVNNMMN